MPLLLCLLTPARVVAGVESDQVPVATPAQIAQWVLQLDDNRYAIRNNAQQELQHVGAPALQAVSQEAQTGSLESSTRALNIMLAWSESADHELQIATLEKLIELPNRPIEASLAAELLADARQLAALKEFTSLGGRYQADPVVRMIGRAIALQVILDSEWKGGLDGLKHLAAVHHATTVSFYFAPISEGVLEYLETIPNLRRIEFFGTAVSAEMVKELEKQFPNVVVDVRPSGALLGISGDGTLQGAVLVMTVRPGSAAAKAGLRPRDQIAELNGEIIKDFADLTQRISKFQPGDTVELTVLRNGQQFKREVTFDRWGQEKSADNVPTFAVPKITLDRR